MTFQTPELHKLQMLVKILKNQELIFHFEERRYSSF